MKLDFTLDAPLLAEKLLGWSLIMSDGKGVRGGVIIETEAYTSFDPASHSFRGKTARNAAMFMFPGTLYVYKIYGIHHCLNIVCGNSDGQAVLIRALQPTKGIAQLRRNRRTVDNKILCNGPAKLYQALDIPASYNAKHITTTNLRLYPPTHVYTTSCSTRIGISKATDILWRYVIT